MPSRAEKITTKKNLIREPSPEIPSPIKTTEPNTIDNNIEIKHELLSNDSKENKIDINSTSIILANGQPLLTNFEEKYLIDLILKISNKDIETILQEKIHFILQMNYGIQSSLFTLNPQWIYDFILKHFQTLINHINSKELFEKILKKNFDKTNSTIVFKHWQLQTLINEHSKTQQQQQKRRMTVRHIDIN